MVFVLINAQDVMTMLFGLGSSSSGGHKVDKKLLQHSQLRHKGEFWHLSVSRNPYGLLASVHNGIQGSVVRIFVDLS